MILLFTASIFRRVVIALYLLGLILPVSVQAGLQLTPTVEYQLLKDIAESRCLSKKDDNGQRHSGQACCIFAESESVPDHVLVLSPLLGTPNPERPQVLEVQTAGLLLGLANLPPCPRGPPFLSLKQNQLVSPAWFA
jgi:hypothetical protein